MRILLFFCCLYMTAFISAQSVGINTLMPDNSALLDITATDKGLLIPRMSEVQKLALTSPANSLLIYQTDGQSGYYYNNGSSGSPSWLALGTPNNTWTLGGNSLLATSSLGTKSNNHMDLITNNITRGRLTNLGEFFIGATNTTIPGDLMGAISNTTFPFAVNGYSSFNGSGVYGTIQAGTTSFAAIQGEYASTAGGTFNTAGVRGSNNSTTAGTGFRTIGGTGPRVGVIGNTSASNGQYTFGLHGSMGSTDIRCAGVIGDDFGLALGALAYFSASLNDYSVYGFGGAYQTGVSGGKGIDPKPNTHIGMGIYGGVMGGWIQGLVYGTHLKGDRYSLYVDGKTYINHPMTELVPTESGNRKPAYHLTTSQPEVYARGKASMKAGAHYVAFDENFLQMANRDDIVITVTPMGKSMGLYISQQDQQGFYVNENGNGNSDVVFSWIAIASRKGLEDIKHAPEIIHADFDKTMNRVMWNDNNTTDKAQSIWWDGNEVRFDAPPPKKQDPLYNTVSRLKPLDNIKNSISH